MRKSIIQPKLGPRPVADYSQAWSVAEARLIFVSGQVSVDAEGNFQGKGDIGLQTGNVLENLRKILEDAGARLEDVIKVNIFVTDMAGYLKIRKDVWRKYFPENFPASTLVEVKALARPEYMVEIEAVAATE